MKMFLKFYQSKWGISSPWKNCFIIIIRTLCVWCVSKFFYLFLFLEWKFWYISKIIESCFIWYKVYDNHFLNVVGLDDSVPSCFMFFHVWWKLSWGKFDRNLRCFKELVFGVLHCKFQIHQIIVCFITFKFLGCVWYKNADILFPIWKADSQSETLQYTNFIGGKVSFCRKQKRQVFVCLKIQLFELSFSWKVYDFLNILACAHDSERNF